MTVANGAYPAAPRSSLDRVHAALDAAGRRPRLRGDHIQARCPLHEDRKPSLSIDWVNDRGGMTKLHCHSCPADEREILEAVGLGLTDRFDQPLPPRDPTRKPAPPPRGTVAPQGNRLGPLPKRLTQDPEPLTPPFITPEQLARSYDYVDETGALLYQVLRYEWATQAGPDKRFTQRQPNPGGGWDPKVTGRRVLWHLPAVVEGIAQGRRIWLCEGEKDAESLNGAVPRDRGVATTNAGGAGNFTEELAAQLRGADIVLVIDRDAAGYRRGADVTRLLHGLAASCRVLVPAVDKDATDHLAAGHGIDDFFELSNEQMQVLVAQAHVQESVKRAERIVGRVEMCLLEAQARRAAADQADERKAAKAAKAQRRYALRWAQEAVKAAGQVGDLAEQTWQQQHQQAVEVPVPLHQQAFLGRAEQAQRTAQRLAGRAWDVTGQPQPAPTQQTLSAPVPSERHAPTPDPTPLPAPTPLPVAPGGPDRPEGKHAQVVPFPTERRGGGNSGGGDARVDAVRTVYQRIDGVGGGLFEIKTRGNDQVRHEVLSLDVRIRRIEVIESDAGAVDTEGIRTVSPQSVLAYVIGYTHPDSGEQILSRIDADRVGNCDWLNDLGIVVDYDSSSKGRAKVWDAIRSTSRDAETVSIYEATGWRELPGIGWTYIHAGGGITPTGPRPLPVRLPAAIDRIDLPDPSADPAELRRMFDRDSRALMLRFPAHVGAVLAGTAYRAVLGLTKPPTTLFGTPGTYKSAAAALTMHHFGVRWERSGASTSMSGHGATINALPELWWHCKDALFFGDDFAPDKSVEAAAQFLSAVGRMQYNQTVRTRVNMRKRGGRGGTDQGFVSRTTLLLTSEVKAFAESGNQRLNVLDLARGDIDLADIIALDAPESRLGRATVMASLLRWMAARCPDHVARATARAGLAAQRRRGEGMDDRVAEPLGELEAGWELVGDWLVATGIYTDDERQAMLSEVRAALTEAGQRSRDPDSPTNVGERVRRLLDSCLRSGAAHVTTPGGYPPPEDEATRLGYRRVPISTVLGEYRFEARGEQLGVITNSVHGYRLHLEPDATMAVILAAARKAGESLAVTKTVVQRELAAIGILRTEREGSVTRYTVPVPDPSGTGGQVRRWDLDANRVFWEPEPPAHSVDNPGPVGPDPYPADQTPAAEPDFGVDASGPNEDDEMAGAYEDTDHRVVDPGSCNECGQVASLMVDGQLLHYSCWKRLAMADDDSLEPAPAPAAAVPEPAAPTPAAAAVPEPALDLGVTPIPPATPVGSDVEVTTATGRQKSATNRRRSPGSASVWKRSIAVIDTSGVYLPDGTSDHPVALDSLDDIAAVGVDLAVGHSAAAGLLVLTEQAMTKLGLMPAAQLLTDPGPDGEPPSEDLVRTRILDYLTENGLKIIGRDGWSVSGDRLGPWSTIRRGDRAFRLVLEPFVWMWDPRTDSRTPFLHLPDPGEDPARCWVELARRLDRLAALLGVPWSSSAGVTGAALFDQIQRRRERRGGRVLDRAGVVPDLERTGQQQLEPELDWPANSRRVDSGRPGRDLSEAELSSATAVHFYDRRGSYLAPSGGADLPVGEPAQIDADAAHQVIDKVVRYGAERLPVGIWQVSLPKWEETMPPPHPDQHRFERVTRWVTTPTLQLLIDHDDIGGAGYTVADLQPGPAWLWQEHGRLLEPWYKQVREALLAARSEGDDPVDRAIKGVYTAYIGRMDYAAVAAGPRPWHHQPVWRAAIIGSSRSGLWRVMRKHQLTTGRVPVSVHVDEVAYLDSDIDPTVNPPAADTGALGKLKPSGTRLLTDSARAALLGGARITDNQVWVDPSGDGV
ncbi:MAG TPA: hypothetical protein VFC16_04465 [Nakamurella sp.]|nr:hypothetical protein [Nakamurella sp.]